MLVNPKDTKTVLFIFDDDIILTYTYRQSFCLIVSGKNLFILLHRASKIIYKEKFTMQLTAQLF